MTVLPQVMTVLMVVTVLRSDGADWCSVLLMVLMAWFNNICACACNQNLPANLYGRGCVPATVGCVVVRLMNRC